MQERCSIIIARVLHNVIATKKENNIINIITDYNIL